MEERRKLSGREQIAGLALSIVVDGLLMLAAWLTGGAWFIDYGRTTLIVPTLVTFGAWYFWRRGLPRQ